MTTLQQAPQVAPARAGDWALPNTLDAASALAEKLANTGMVPDTYRGKPDDIVAAMMLGASLGFAPMQSLQGIAVIRGKPAVWGDAMLAVCQNHPAWGGMEETFEGQGKDLVAVCEVWRRGEKGSHKHRFGVSHAVQAGLWGNKGPWTNYPSRMLQMRARAFALRAAFADALKGLSSAEEMRDALVVEASPDDGKPARPGRGAGGLKAQLGITVEDAEPPDAVEPEDDPRDEDMVREEILLALRDRHDGDEESVAKSLEWIEGRAGCLFDDMELPELLKVAAAMEKGA